MIEDARQMTLVLLNTRAGQGSICPSEVARALIRPAGAGPGAPNWRSVMPAVHAAVDQLVSEGAVRISWKGATLATRAGPYRISREVIVK